MAKVPNFGRVRRLSNITTFRSRPPTNPEAVARGMTRMTQVFADKPETAGPKLTPPKRGA